MDKITEIVRVEFYTNTLEIEVIKFALQMIDN